MARGDEAGDGLSGAERNMLRVIDASGGHPVPAGEVARGLGISRQAVAGTAKVLKAAGMLLVRVGPRYVTYEVTEAGRAELAARQSLYLLVEADDRLGDDVYAYLSQGVNGIVSVTEHGSGCCCKNCPWGGDHG